MGYIVLIIVFVFILKWVEKKFFRWETVIGYLWKKIYQHADLIAEAFRLENKENEFGKKYAEEKYTQPIKLMGNTINSILDLVNYFNKNNDKNAEEETFGYGRFNFDTILNMAKSDSNAFKNK